MKPPAGPDAQRALPAIEPTLKRRPMDTERRYTYGDIAMKMLPLVSACDHYVSGTGYVLSWRPGLVLCEACADIDHEPDDLELLVHPWQVECVICADEDPDESMVINFWFAGVIVRAFICKTCNHGVVGLVDLPPDPEHNEDPR